MRLWESKQNVIPVFVVPPSVVILNSHNDHKSKLLQFFVGCRVQWSLGVTLWEMITHGSSPYADVDVSSYLDYIRSGYRLPQLTNIQNELQVF